MSSFVLLSGGLAGALTLNAVSGVVIEDDGVGSANHVQISGDTDTTSVGVVTISTAQVYDTGNGLLTIEATDLDLIGSISTGTGSVSIVTSQAGTTIGIGGVSKDFSLSTGELVHY